MADNEQRKREALTRAAAMILSLRAGDEEAFRAFMDEAIEKDPRWTMYVLVKLATAAMNEISQVVEMPQDEIFSRMGAGFPGWPIARDLDDES